MLKKIVGIIVLFSISLFSDTHMIFDDIQPKNIWTDSYSNKFYFTYDDGIHGNEIWASDGTTSGTHMVADLQTGSDTSINISSAGVINNRFIFYWNQKSQWYVTDGTEAGTIPFTDDKNTSYTNSNSLFYSSYGNNWVKIGNKLIENISYSDIGSELLITDGTKNGTYRIDLNPGSSGSNPNNFIVSPDGSKVFFIATTGTYGKELWVSNGTISGTHMVKDIKIGTDSGLYNYTSYGCIDKDKLLFAQKSSYSDNYSYWITDGMEAGTFKLFDDIQPKNIWTDSYSNKFYFTYDDGIHGNEIWASDGTTSGTHMVADLQTGSDTSINISSAGVINNRFIFYWNQKSQWYVTDGTEAGTIPFTDDKNTSYTNSNSLFYSSYGNNWVKIGNKLIENISYSDIGSELLITDGTKNGTYRIDLNPGSSGSNPNNFIVSPDGSKVFFIATTGTYGKELWVSNGTISGTKLILDAAYGTDDGFNNYKNFGFTNIDYLLFEQKNNYNDNWNFWSSDGLPYEEYGTCLVSDANYTKADIDKAYKKGVEDTKKQCKLDPSSCGITNTVANMDNDFINNLKNGWNLVGTSLPIDNFTIFQGVDTVWYYNNEYGKWEVFSPDLALENTISQSGSIMPLQYLKANSGFWIFK